jgi:ribosome maturation factor RimP
MDHALAALTDEIRGRVRQLGYELVDLRRRGSGRRLGLQVRIDRAGSAPGHGITVDECARVSRALEAWLDASGTLGERYLLEVSSPGIERPIRWREHWERFVGHDVQVRVPGRGRVRATIVRVATDRDAVTVRPTGETAEVELEIGEALGATLVVEWSAIGRAAGGRRGH